MILYLKIYKHFYFYLVFIIFTVPSEHPTPKNIPSFDKQLLTTGCPCIFIVFIGLILSDSIFQQVIYEFPLIGFLNVKIVEPSSEKNAE